MRQTTVQQIDHFTSTFKAIRGMLGLQPSDNVAEPFRNFRVDLADRPRIGVGDTTKDAIGGFRPKRRPSGASGVQHATQAEQIAAMIDRFASCLLGRHVLWGPRDDARLSHRSVIHRASHTKIGDPQSLDTIAQQNVGGFDIAMHQPLLMSRTQASGNLSTDPHHLDHAQRSSFVDPLL